MARFPELDPTSTTNSTFRRLFAYTDALIDQAEQRLGDDDGATSTRRVRGTDIILSSGYNVELRTQNFHRTVNVIGPKSKVIPIVKVTSTGPTSAIQLTRDDANPAVLDIYPQTGSHLHAKISRVSGRFDDMIHLWVADTAWGKSCEPRRIAGQGDSQEDGYRNVGELSEESLARLTVIYHGLRIATSSIIDLLDEKPTDEVLRRLREDHTQLFMVEEADQTAQ